MPLPSGGLILNPIPGGGWIQNPLPSGELIQNPIPGGDLARNPIPGGGLIQNPLLGGDLIQNPVPVPAPAQGQNPIVPGEGPIGGIPSGSFRGIAPRGLPDPPLRDFQSPLAVLGEPLGTGPRPRLAPGQGPFPLDYNVAGVNQGYFIGPPHVRPRFVENSSQGNCRDFSYEEFLRLSPNEIPEWFYIIRPPTEHVRPNPNPFRFQLWIPTIGGNPITVNGTAVIINGSTNSFIINGVMVAPPVGVTIANLNNDAILNILVQLFGPQSVQVRPGAVPENFPPMEEVPPGTPGTRGGPLGRPSDPPPSLMRRGIRGVRSVGGGNIIIIGLQAWEIWRSTTTPCEEIRERYRVTIMEFLRRANRGRNSGNEYKIFIAQLRDFLPALNGGPVSTGGVPVGFNFTLHPPTIEDMDRYGFNCAQWTEIQAAELSSPSYTSPGPSPFFNTLGEHFDYSALTDEQKAILQTWQDRVNANIERLKNRQCAREELSCVIGRLIEAAGGGSPAIAELIENNCNVRRWLQDPTNIPNPEAYVGGLTGPPTQAHQTFSDWIDNAPPLDRERIDLALSTPCTPTETCVGNEQLCYGIRTERTQNDHIWACPSTPATLGFTTFRTCRNILLLPAVGIVNTFVATIPNTTPEQGGEVWWRVSVPQGTTQLSFNGIRTVNSGDGPLTELTAYLSKNCSPSLGGTPPIPPTGSPAATMEFDPPLDGGLYELSIRLQSDASNRDVVVSVTITGHV